MSNKSKRVYDELSMRMFTTYPDTDEYKLLEIEMEKRIEAYRKPKKEEMVVEQTEVTDINDFQREDLLNQILNEVKEISNEVKEIRSLVGQIAEGQVEMEKSILSRLKIFEERINRT